MVEQYPHTVTITYGGTLTQGSDGVMGYSGQSSMTFKGRAENAGNDPTIITPDGKKVTYSYIVYCKKRLVDIPYGADVAITLESGGIVTGKVKNASNGQLNSRIWV